MQDKTAPAADPSLSDDLLHHFDHADVEYGRRVDDANRELRRCPVVYSDQHGGFRVLSRYSDVVAAMSNHDVFSSAAGHKIPHGPQPVLSIPSETDPPLHTEYRQILWPFLTPRAVSAYEPYVRATATELIDEVAGKKRMDVLNEYARPLPARVTGQFFGMSIDEGERCYAWTETMIGQTVDDPSAARAAANEFFNFLQQKIDAARETPGDTLIDAIVGANVDGRPLSNDEALGMLLSSITGALETTVGTIALGINLLARHPDQRARLVAEPSLMPHAVEEVLRIEPAAFAPARTAVAGAELGGVPVCAGDPVLLLFRSANHDEAVFPNPEAFRVDRPNNRHLGFGYGIHKCIGQHLARLELQVAFEELLKRIPHFEVEGDPQPHVRGGQTWGLSELAITWN